MSLPERPGRRSWRVTSDDGLNARWFDDDGNEYSVDDPLVQESRAALTLNLFERMLGPGYLSVVRRMTPDELEALAYVALNGKRGEKGQRSLTALQHAITRLTAEQGAEAER